MLSVKGEQTKLMDGWSADKLPVLFLCLTAFFIPVATAPVNLMSLLVLLSVVFVSTARARLRSLLKDPLVILIVIFYALILFSLLNPLNDPTLNSAYLAKYFRFLLIPVFASTLSSAEDAGRVLKSFVFGVVVTVLGSYLVFFGLLVGENNTYFKGYITHGFFVCLAFFWFFLQSKKKPANFQLMDWVFFLTSAVLLINLFLMVDGRTGWLAFFVALGFFSIRKVDLKKQLILMVLACIAFAALYNFSATFHERISLGLHEVLAWSQAQKDSNQTSMGLRLSFWLYSLKAFQLHPLFGYGVGGFQNAVGHFSVVDGFELFKNPHNQFFLFLVQIGLVGLLLYLAILYLSLKRSLKNDWFFLFLIAFIASSFFNSFNYDFAESYAFAVFLACFGVRSRQ